MQSAEKPFCMVIFLCWNNCIDVCTFDAETIVSNTSGFLSRYIHQTIPIVIFLHHYTQFKKCQFQASIRIAETCSTFRTFQVSLIVNGDIINSNFLIWKIKCVNIRKICRIHWRHMIQNQIWVKYPFKGKLTNITIQKCKRFIDMDSDSTLWLIFKKLPLVKMEYSIKNSYNYLKKTTKILLFFSNIIFVWGQLFLIFFKQKNLLQEIECKNRNDSPDLFC